MIFRSFNEDKANDAPKSTSTISSRRQELREEKAESTEKKAEASVELPKEESPLDDFDNLDDLMATDEKEMGQDQVDQTLAAAAAGAQAVSQNSENDAELAKALEEKEKVIADLKSEIDSLKEKLANPAPAQASNPELEQKVKELSEKLAEYEIIEDDIANLSFYKNENAKLKNELDKLRGANASVLAAEAAKDESSAEPELSEVEESTKKEASKTEETTQEAAPATSDNSILSEFEEAVRQKEALEKSGIADTGSSAPISVASEADLLKEFENAVEKELAAEGKAEEVKADSPKAEDKPASESVPAEEVKSGNEVDSDKLVAELEALADAPPPAANEDEKDSNQKLIEEFENFVNKSN